jgi:hypothetical protein
MNSSGHIWSWLAYIWHFEVALTAVALIVLLASWINHPHFLIPLVGIEMNPGPGKNGRGLRGNKGNRNPSSRKNKQLNSGHSNLFGDPILETRFSGTPYTRENKVYDFVQFIDQSALITAGPLTSTGVGNVYIGEYVNFNNLAQYATFQALFDQYRIAMIEMVFVPRTNMITASTGVTSVNTGLVYSFVDYDDAVAPTTIAQAQQRQNCLCVPGYQQFSHCWVPHISMSAFPVGGSAIAGVQATAPWLDTTLVATPHYGVKVCWSQTSTSEIQSYDIITRVHIQFRNTL